MKNTELSCEINAQGNKVSIISNGEAIAKVKFFDYKLPDGYELSDEEKISLTSILATSMQELFSSVCERKSWEEKCQAFKEAYECEEFKNDISIIWLMNNILGISIKEATKRYEIGSELMSHPDFKDKTDSVIEKIYCSNSHL